MTTKKRTLFFVVSLLMLSIAGNIYLGLRTSHEVPPHKVLPDDSRIAFTLKNEYREHIMMEMRQFVQSIHMISQGIEENNPALLIEAGAKSGTSVGKQLPFNPRELVPEGFLRMGGPTHQLFDAIADSARTNYNPKTAQRQLTELTNKCVMCHSTYRITPTR